MDGVSRRGRAEPVTTEVASTTSVDMGQAEQTLSEFLDNSMLSQRVSVVKQTVLGQLKRVQRDLRGLPPMLVNDETGESVADSQYVTNSVDAGQAAEAATETGKKVSKEDRKKAKKERRKQEKREKAAKKSKKDEDEDDNDNDEEDDDEMDTD